MVIHSQEQRSLTDDFTNATRSPTALLIPARSHPEVIIAAVAARDKKKAEAYAKKHGIPIVHESYDGKYPFFFSSANEIGNCTLRNLLKKLAYIRNRISN